MTLAGWTLPQTPTGRASTVPPPPWHYSGDIIAVDFTADPARVAELVPVGFSPRGDGSCTFFFCDWCSAADRDPRVKDDPIKGQYREAYVTLNGTFDGRPFGRVPYIWVDSELSLLRGQIQGFPKKLGEIHMTRAIDIGKGGARKAPGERFAAHVSSLGRRLATAAVTLRGDGHRSAASGRAAADSHAALAVARARSAGRARALDGHGDRRRDRHGLAR